MSSVNLAIKALVFLVLGVGLPGLAIDIIGAARASRKVQEPLFWTWFYRALITHIILAVAILWGWRWVVNEFAGRHKKLQGIVLTAIFLILVSVYAWAIFEMVVLW